MPQKLIDAPYPLIDSDPHASRVIRYFRPSDYCVVVAGTIAAPSALYLWGITGLRSQTLVLTEHGHMQKWLTPPAYK